MSDKELEGRSRGQPKHPIRVAARRAGLTATTVRAWERRYGAVAPARTSTSRRLYSDADVERLQLISELSSGGYSVGEVAPLPTTQLRALKRASDEAKATGGKADLTVVEDVAEACRDAVTSMDATRLQSTLMQAISGLEARRILEDVIAPLLRGIGTAWESGELSVAHEHAATVAVRQTLGWMLAVIRMARPVSSEAPSIVVGTPEGERHELGALMAAVVAASVGWHVTYLGASCPAADVATAVVATKASAIALGITSAAPRLTMQRELHELRLAAGDEVPVVIGGDGAMALSAALLDDLDVRRVESLGGFRQWLESRTQSGRSAA